VTLSASEGTVPAKGKLTVTATIAREAADIGFATVTAIAGTTASAEARLDWTNDAPPAGTTSFLFAFRIDGEELTPQRSAQTSPPQGNKFSLPNLPLLDANSDGVGDETDYIVVGVLDANNDGDFDDDEDGTAIYSPKGEGVCTTAGCGRVTLKPGDVIDDASLLMVGGFNPGTDTGAGRGDGALGGACASSSDCGDGLYCEVAFADFGGYCTTDCNGGPSECPAGSTCFNISGDDVYQICFKDCTDAADCGRDNAMCDGDGSCVLQ
jgi:hypothetical protein